MKFWENEMKKALNVLKDLCKVMTFNSYWLPRVDEAIKELEAMKPKTCISCENYSYEGHNVGICSYFTCPKTDMFLNKDFYCNRYEAKAEQC